MAENTGKIYITISDERGKGVGDNEKRVKADEEREQERQQLVSGYVQHEFYSLVKNKARQIANYTIGNVGFFTGDYQAQREINSALSLASSLKNIGMSIWTGAKVAGGAGAIVAGVTTVASELITYGLQEHTANLENKRTNYNIDRLRQISGLDTLTNGSR